MERESGVPRNPPPSPAGVARHGFEFSRHPAVAPPGWDPTKTESGDGLTERRAILISVNTDNQFFFPLVAGFYDALNAFGWTGDVRGDDQDGVLDPLPEFIGSAVDELEAGDVIVTMIPDREPFVDPIQRALDDDIVVVNSHVTPPATEWNYETQQEQFTYTSPVTGDDRGVIIPHVGIRDERGGAAMAAEMYERLQDQNPNQEEYTVFLVNDLSDNSMVTRRINEAAANEGTAQRYFEAQDDVRIFGDRVFTSPQPPEVADARAFVVDNIQGDDVDAVVSSAFWSAVGAGSAVEAGELEEDMLVCGFDLAGMTGTGDDGPIANGGVDFVVGQDMYSQGYASASAARAYLERGVPPKDLEWGVSVWDERNIEFATQRRSWSDLLDWQSENYDGIE